MPALLAQLRDPDGREALRQAVEEGSPDPHAAQSKVVLIGWGNVRISGTSNPDLKRFEGKYDGRRRGRGRHHAVRPDGPLHRGRRRADRHRDVPAGRGRPARGLHASAAHGRIGWPAAARHQAASARLRHVPARRRPAAARGLVFAGGRGAPDDLGGGAAIRPRRPRADTTGNGCRPGAVRRQHRGPRHVRFADRACRPACAMSGWRARQSWRTATSPADGPDGFWAVRSGRRN